MIERSKILENISKMQDLAKSLNLKLRPHIKTHKIPQLAKIQLEYGADGIATAKLSEAEVMSSAGIDDILIANIIIGDKKIERLRELNGKCSSLSLCVDSIEGVNQLRKAGWNDKKLNVFIEIDVGFNRCGLSDYSAVVKLAKYIEQTPELNLVGLLSHSGQIYSAKTKQEAINISRAEICFLSDLSRKLSKDGVEISEISIGATPSVIYYNDLDTITELRVGNYIFYDMIQVALGSAGIENCALSVLSQVISIPAKNRAVIDAGSKALGTEKGVHSYQLTKGFGFIYYKKAEITRLSEEHGIIEFDDETFSIGEKVRIIPNHACYVMNLFDYCYLVDGNQVIERLEITARGKSQ